MGYAFAQVTPRGDRNFENRTISVVYAIDQGPRTYVERIEIRGNERTRDFVIRREFDISEGDAFNQVLVQRAKRRLEALDYFTSVEISTAPGSEPDQVILVIDLVEKSTGEFSIGGGYTTGGETAGPSVEGSITERNFLGRGQFIRFSAGGGQNSRDFMLSFTEPYFLGPAHRGRLRHLPADAHLRQLQEQRHRRHDPFRPADHAVVVDADRLQSVEGRIRIRRRLHHGTACSTRPSATSRWPFRTAWTTARGSSRRSAAR